MTSVKSLYVHMPFCVHHCFYCDYAVEARGERARSRESARQWLDAVVGEWRLLRAEGRTSVEGPLSTLYLGGGTPSALGRRGVEGLARLLEGHFPGEGLEWTVEANPEDVTPALLNEWRELGVTRISLGIQSFQDEPLRWLGRLHDGGRGREALDQVLDAGFGSVSVDLLFGLPEEVDRDWEGDLLRVARSGVSHVTLYALPPAGPSPSGKTEGEGPSTRASPERYLLASSLLGSAGFEHYGVEAFARPGHRSRHNQVYWSGLPYLGLGPGAHSFLPPLRRWNLEDWAAYSTVVRSGHLPLAESEQLSPGQRKLEALWCALRTRDGAPFDLLPPEWEGRVERWREWDWVEEGHGVLRCTPAGWLHLDEIVTDLARALPA